MGVDKYPEKTPIWIIILGFTLIILIPICVGLAYKLFTHQ